MEHIVRTHREGKHVSFFCQSQVEWHWRYAVKRRLGLHEHVSGKLFIRLECCLPRVHRPGVGNVFMCHSILLD